MIIFTLSIRMALVQELLHPRVSTSYSRRGRGELGGAAPAPQFNPPEIPVQHPEAAQPLSPCTLHRPWTDPLGLQEIWINLSQLFAEPSP